MDPHNIEQGRGCATFEQPTYISQLGRKEARLQGSTPLTIDDEGFRMRTSQIAPSMCHQSKEAQKSGPNTLRVKYTLQVILLKSILQLYVDVQVNWGDMG